MTEKLMRLFYVQQTISLSEQIAMGDLGSASVVTDSSGTVVGEDRFYPYGETRFTTGTMYTDKLFTGQREMAGLGIYHYGARFYSPKLGRFLSADTIVPGAGNPQAWNRYSYVLGNPIKYNDPTGHGVDCGIGMGCVSPYVPPLVSGNNNHNNHNNQNNNGGGGGCGQSGYYSPSCPGWHEYTDTSLVCPAYLNCTTAEMIDYLSRFAFPGQDPSIPVSIIGFHNVTDPWYGLLPESIGPIWSEVSPNGLTVTNHTLPGHILHDGVIVRNAFQGPKGEWYVTTHGYGNNVQREVFDAQRPDLPPVTVNLALANIWGGKAIFSEVDRQMRSYILADHVTRR